MKPNFQNLSHRFLVVALSLFASVAAHAHTIWIEPKQDQLVIRFAEPGSDFETSPGYLDALSMPLGFVVITNAPKAVEVSKHEDNFALKGAARSQTAGTETTFTVRGGRKPVFYARWQPDLTSAGKPMLTLDLVPTGKPGEVRIYFRGKPLGGIAATLRAPGQKDQEITADAEGFLHFKTDAAGQYLLTIPHYRESAPLAGFHNGVAYRKPATIPR